MVDHLDDRRGRRVPPRRPAAPACRSNSTSLEALERLPSLSLSRWIESRCARRRAASAAAESRTARRACASTRNASHIGAEQNHLWPVERVARPAPRRRRRRAVVFARTSEPPCFSVIPMPISAPGLSRPGAGRGSYSSDAAAAPTRPPARLARSAGRPHRSSRSGSRAGLRLAQRRTSRRAATWAPGSGSRHGQGVQPVAHRGADQRVPGRVKLDLVDAVAEPVVGAQLGRVLVRLAPQRERLRRAWRMHRPRPPAPRRIATLAAQRLDQHPVTAEGVVARRLVGRAWFATSWVAASRGRSAVDISRIVPSIPSIPAGPREQAARPRQLGLERQPAAGPGSALRWQLLRAPDRRRRARGDHTAAATACAAASGSSAIRVTSPSSSASARRRGGRRRRGRGRRRRGPAAAGSG